MHELCTEAFDGTAFGEDDVIFQPGQAGRYMYIGGGHDDPSRSILTYIRQRKVERLSVSTVFIAEAVLWTNWKHEGKLTANQPLVMLRVKWKQFGEVVEQDAAAFRVARAHCERFLKELDAGRVKEVENDTCSISFNSREGTQSDSVA
jgi:RNA-binding protein YlmH